MKAIIFILILLVTYSCNKRNETAKTIDSTSNLKLSEVKAKILQDTIANGAEDIQSEQISLAREFKDYKIYKLNDTIKIDLNNDNFIDLTFFVNKNNIKNIMIIDGQSKKIITVGLDKSFGEMGTNFSWVDFWGTTIDKETSTVIVEDGEIIGGEQVELKNPSIFVRKHEEGGGVITFKENKFIWVHQAE